MTASTAPPQPPAPAYLDTFPEWETPQHKPKPSLIDRLRSSTAPKPRPTSTTTADVHKEELGTLPTHHGSVSTHSTAAGTVSDRPLPTGITTTLRSRLDGIFPPHRRYVRNRLTRRAFLLVLLCAFLALLALILGLAIGLSRRHSSHDALPLPSTGGIYTGDLTYYAPGLGACGWTSSSEDAIVAVAWETFDAAAGGAGGNPNNNPLCGKRIRITRDQGTGSGNKSVDVTVVDRCTGCKPTDLDLSPSAFDVLAERALGRVTGSWAWL